MSKKVSVDVQDFVLASMNRHAPSSAEWGTYEVSRSNKVIMSKVKYVLTTGIESFDEISGGFPFGRIVEYIGLENSGKTAMAIRAAVRAREGCISEVVRDETGTLTYRPLDPSEYEVAVLYVDNEGSLDEDNKLKVDGKKLDVITGRCDTIEGVFKMTNDFLDGAEAKVEADAEAAEKAGKEPKLLFLVIIVDTIASTSSREELAAEWGKRDFPRVPGEISKGFSKIVRRLNVMNACMICTNQVRTKFQQGAPVKAGRGGGGTPQSWQFSSPGGFALRFYSTHRIFAQALASKYKLLPDAKFPAGLLIAFHSIKNRLRPQDRDGRMVLLYDKDQGGLNSEFSVLENLIFTGFIEVGSEKGTDFTCKFAKNSIATTTFGDAQVKTTLDEDDAVARPRARSRKDPGFKYRSEWPKFYAEHKADIDNLWKAAVQYTFNTPGLDGTVIAEDDLAEEIAEET